MAASASVARRASGFTSDRVRARPRTAAGIVGRRVRGAVRASTTSQPGSAGSNRSSGPGDGALPGSELRDDQLPLRRGREDRRVDPERDRLVVAGEPLRCALDRLAGRAEQRVDAGQELRTLVLARRDGDALGGEERGGSRRLASSSAAEERLGSPGSNPWTTSNAPIASVAARLARTPIGSATLSAQGRRHRRADRDDVPDRAALQGAPALEQVGGARRGRDHGHRVPAPAQRLRRAADVLVDVVRL